MDRGFFITLAAVRRQLAAMPSELFQLRLIHGRTRKPFPAITLWSAYQLSRADMVRFLRLRNREGFDIYVRPYAGQRNGGYVLLDLDQADASVLGTLRANGHEPCVVVQSSAGHLQAWLRISAQPLEPAVANAIGRSLADLYGADPASTDWCHLGRLAGFTNQKPRRRQLNGHAPWVRLLHAQPQLATNGAILVEAAEQGCLAISPPPLASARPRAAGPSHAAPPSHEPVAPVLLPAAAAAIYQRLLKGLRIPQRFPQPDWSIADLWITKQLLRWRTPTAQVFAILRLGSPGFPRSHAHPDDYLARTLRRARLELDHAAFFSRPRARCVPPGPHP